MAAYGTIKDSELTITGIVAEIDGSRIIKQTITGPVTDAEKIGKELAERLINMGAGEILEKLTQEFKTNEK
jgi:hydroxymethylbilane synthase